jgi:uncharacterized protein YaaN involved in tellurite resistance
MDKLLTKQEKAQLNKIAARMAKHRDALREIQSELEQLAIPNENAIEQLTEAIESLSEVV